MAGGRYLRQREYPHPPPPSTNNSRRIINMVVMFHLFSVPMQCRLGTKAGRKRIQGRNPGSRKLLCASSAVRKARSASGRTSKGAEPRRRTRGRAAVLSRGAYIGASRRRMVQALCHRRSTIRSKRAGFGWPSKEAHPAEDWAPDCLALGSKRWLTNSVPWVVGDASVGVEESARRTRPRAGRSTYEHYHSLAGHSVQTREPA
jgi:hypothetical protein